MEERRNTGGTTPVKDLALLYYTKKWIPVPVPKGTKAPKIPNWTEYTPTDFEDFADSNIGVILGERSNWLTDIDIDDPEALRIVDMFLPATASFGRQGKPKSHRLFYCEHSQNKKYQLDGKMIIEIRSTGSQTIFPNSTHPSGEQIEWYENTQPTTIEWDTLRKAVGRIAAAVLLSKQWTQGTRQDLSLAVGGWLIRRGWNDEEVKQFLTAVCVLASDDEYKQRIQSVGYTKGKVEEGKPATGFNRLTEMIGLDTAKRLAEWLEIDSDKTEQESKLPFEVLGFNKNNEVIVYYRGEIIKFTTQQLNKKTLQLYTWAEDYSELASKILDTAREKGLIESETPTYKEMGIWKLEEGFLIINGRESYLYNGELHRLNVPKIGGSLIELGGAKWLDMDRLARELREASLYATFLELYDLVTQWEFDDSDGDMARLFTAFVMLAPFQQAMSWRPWLYVTGARGVGKTTLFDEILGIYGELTVRLDKTTAHAIMQKVGSTGKILILDEFELKNSRSEQTRVEQILELLKTASRGGLYERGTTSDKAKSWALHHMVWLGSIYPQLEDAAQRSRTILFELRHPTRAQLRTLTHAEKEELAHKIIASMLKNWENIEKLAQEIIQRKGDYKETVQDGRVVDNLAYASALLETINPDWKGLPATENRWIEDEKELLITIINSSDDEGNIVGQLLNEGSGTEKGVKWVEHRGKRLLAIVPDLVERYLLKDTKWKGRTNEIESLLRRVSDSKNKETVKMAGMSKRAYLISEEKLRELDIGLA